MRGVGEKVGLCSSCNYRHGSIYIVYKLAVVSCFCHNVTTLVAFAHKGHCLVFSKWNCKNSNFQTN